MLNPREERARILSEWRELKKLCERAGAKKSSEVSRTGPRFQIALRNPLSFNKIPFLFTDTQKLEFALLLSTYAHTPKFRKTYPLFGIQWEVGLLEEKLSDRMRDHTDVQINNVKNSHEFIPLSDKQNEEIEQLKKIARAEDVWAEERPRRERGSGSGGGGGGTSSASKEEGGGGGATSAEELARAERARAERAERARAERAERAEREAQEPGVYDQEVIIPATNAAGSTVQFTSKYGRLVKIIVPPRLGPERRHTVTIRRPVKGQDEYGGDSGGGGGGGGGITSEELADAQALMTSLESLKEEFENSIILATEAEREGNPVRALEKYTIALGIFFNDDFAGLRKEYEGVITGYMEKAEELKSNAAKARRAPRISLRRFLDQVFAPSARRQIDDDLRRRLEAGEVMDSVAEFNPGEVPIIRELPEDGWLAVETPEISLPGPTDEFESLESVPGSPPRRIRPTEDAPHYAASLAVAARDQFGGSINHLYKNIYDTKTQNWYSVDSHEGRSILKAYLQKLL